MRKLILGSGLSLVVMGGAVTSQAQTDSEADKASDKSITMVEDQETKSTGTPYLKLGDIKGETQSGAQLKIDGVDGEAPARSDGYVKLGDIKGEAQERSSGYLKIGDIKGESQERSSGYLKLGDIKGESQTALVPDTKIEPGLKDESFAPNTKAGEPTLKQQEQSPEFKIEINGAKSTATGEPVLKTDTPEK